MFKTKKGERQIYKERFKKRSLILSFSLYPSSSFIFTFTQLQRYIHTSQLELAVAHEARLLGEDANIRLHLSRPRRRRDSTHSRHHRLRRGNLSH